MKKQQNLIDDYSYKIVLQQLAENEYASIDISDFDFKSFSNTKEMFDYQQEALQNAFRVLIQFYQNFTGDKENFYNKGYKKYSHSNLDYIKPSKLLQDNNYPMVGTRVEFYHFVNRMGFWMTMGSGKTIVIIKLIELLDLAMDLGLIPKKNILFFTANENLLERFKQEINEYNILKDKEINPINLKYYEKIKNNLFEKIEIKLFCYRADLMGEERKEAILDYKDYLDSGNNYVILDEAHKGDKQDSKRQNIFSVLSKNGFLFNFSATFTDKSDIVTTIYNLNQIVWIKNGYGKKLFLLDNNLKAFKDKTDLNELEKQKATLKSLLLLAFAKKYKLSNSYHNPMMVVFTNSVNVVQADAELFFKTLGDIVKNDVEDIFKEAKEELEEEFKNTKYLITDKEGEGVFEFANEIEKLTLKELKQSIFYALHGNIEAIINPKNKSEIAFKLDSADKPFCLIKIGDISSWIKEKLKNIKIDETFKESSFFESLDTSSINILLGSRSFYEGWDTNRPNIMLFLNIGMDKEAKKFVTQSIGRGARIQSVDGSRQRLDFIDTGKKAQIQQNSKPLETLFLVSTNKEAISSILQYSDEQSRGMDWEEISFDQNIEAIKDKILFIPVYKSAKTKANKINSKGGLKISKKNKDDLIVYKNNFSNELFALKYNIFDKKECDLFFDMVSGNNILFIDKNIHYKSLDFLIQTLKNRLYINHSDIDKFKPLNNEIIHFKKIKVREDKAKEVKEIKKRAIEMQNLSDDEVHEKSKIEGIPLKVAVEKYQIKELQINEAKFKKILRHYYNPIVKAENSDWIKNIISVDSEIEFLTNLESIYHLIEEKYDWWVFSKINEHLDNIFIPYVENGQEHKFYPDFIFWLQENDTQTILFVDPKGNKHTAYEHKVDGYKKLFLEKNSANLENKIFEESKVKIKVKLVLIKDSSDSVGEEYEKHWISKNNLESMFS